VIPTERIDLLERVEKMRDSTLDGSHRASQQETHFLTIWDPYDSKHTQRSASFASARMLREQHHRHVRSQYHPRALPTESNTKSPRRPARSRARAAEEDARPAPTLSASPRALRPSPARR
jgi:hypothetical protein